MMKSSKAGLENANGAPSNRTNAASATPLSRQSPFISDDLAAEQAAWPQQENKDHRGIDQLIGKERKADRPKAAQQTVPDCGEQRAGDRAHATDHGNDEAFDQDRKPHPRRERAHRRRQRPRQPRQPPPRPNTKANNAVVLI